MTLANGGWCTIHPLVYTYREPNIWFLDETRELFGGRENAVEGKKTCTFCQIE
jgi:hypothetical protein